MIDLFIKTPNCLLLEVINPHRHHDDAIRGLDELESLVTTYGGKVIERIVQHRPNPHPATYIGEGKIEQVKEIVRQKNINVVILNAVVSPGQIFRLEKELWPVNSQISVWDKTDLILSIFEQHAATKEAKLQISLARLQHVGPRIYGLGGTYFSQQAGGIGTRGIGETNIELMKRHLKEHTRNIKRELEKITKHKQETISRRKDNGIKTVALVGYTNAGKTSLFNLLTGKNKLIKDSLFTTLDSVVGKLNYGNKVSEIVISDTIGFIDGLPPLLIEAFRSTLMESLSAEIILHVVDIADKDIERKILAVENIIKDIIPDAKRQIIFNKIDLLSREQITLLITKYNNNLPILISVKNRSGINNLVSKIINI